MPELPEVESVRRSLEPHLLGAPVASVRLIRRDILTGSAAPAALLAGDAVARLHRRGKQLAIIGASGRVLVVHLGMSGQLFFRAQPPAAEVAHVHAVWKLPRGQLVFRDPRRFGGLVTLPNGRALDEHWSPLGPDALSIDDAALAAGLAGSRRTIKAALLDQALLAGVGNIYADEALFLARIAPQRSAGRLKTAEVSQLAAAIRTILAQAVAAGGSTLRDFLNGDGQPGGYAGRHAVYGRGGLPCPSCRRPLRQTVLGQRTTVWCAACQGPRGKVPPIHNSSTV